MSENDVIVALCNPGLQSNERVLLAALSRGKYGPASLRGWNNLLGMEDGDFAEAIVGLVTKGILLVSVNPDPE